MEKICVGIVTYNPELNRLEENISLIFAQASHIYICDNGSDNIKKIEKLVAKYKNIELINNGHNYGIAYALNRLFEHAKSKEYCWLLSLDQDSVAPVDMIEKLSCHLSENIGIVSPRFSDPFVKYGSNYKCEKEIYSEIENCITSGSLTNVDAWSKVDGFDELMFIDFVDFDFCYRLRKSGFKILRRNDLELKHTIGRIEGKKLFGKKIFITNHSSLRKYYIARNYIYYRKKNGIKDSKQRDAMRNKIIKTILLESNRIETINAYVRGYIDGNRVIKGKAPLGWKK